MDKINRNIVNIILNYIKPIHYLEELQETIKNIKYDRVFNNDLHDRDYISNAIVKFSNKWDRNIYMLKYDYRLSYLYLCKHL